MDRVTQCIPRMGTPYLKVLNYKERASARASEIIAISINDRMELELKDIRAYNLMLNKIDIAFYYSFHICHTGSFAK